MAMNISGAIRSLIAKLPTTWVPVKGVSVIDSRSEPPTIARGMTADLIHGVLSSAEAGNTRDLFSLYRDMIASDSHLQMEIFKRKLAVLGDQMTIQPFDKESPDDVKTAAAVDLALKGVRGWTVFCSNLLDGSLYPVSIIEKVFGQNPGGTGFTIRELVQVPYQLLDYQDGHLKISESDVRGNPLPARNDPDPHRYIVHRGHLLSAPDNWGGPMRSVLFWWLLTAMDREWWARFLERYGSPFLVGKYGDDDGHDVLYRAFSLATRLGGLVISKETDAEIKQAAASDSGSAYEKFLELCQREKSKLVLGQTLSSDAKSTGLGDGVAKLQGDVRDDIRQFDARFLAETVRDQLLVQFCQINNLPGNPPRIAFGSESDKAVMTTVALLKGLSEANLEVTDESINALSQKVGLGIQRKSSGPSLPFNIPAPRVKPFSVAAKAQQAEADRIDQVAQAGAADLSRAFRGIMAPVSRIIRESRSASECEDRIRAFCVSMDTKNVDEVLTQALEAFAANGSIPRSA